MRLFIDTANIEEIREIGRWGVLSGVTTNPSLVAKAGRDLHEVIAEIAALVPGPISAEVISVDADGMYKEGLELAELAENVTIKVPMTEGGLEATSRLADEGLDVNVTLVFSANQALLAAAAGAAYVSPFLGRLDDIGHDGLEVVAEIVEAFERYAMPTEVIAASIRHPLHVIGSARAGADIATVPYKVLKSMVCHPLTERGLDMFIKDWQAQR